MAISVLMSNYKASYSVKPKMKKEGWSKPPKDYVKINVDAGFDIDNLKGTTGAVARNHKGQFIAACNSKIEYVHDALSAEVYALKQGLQLAESLGCNRVIINSDNHDVVVTMKEGGNSQGVAAAIFDDCYYMAKELVSVRYEHSSRDTNQVAHELAQMAKYSDHKVWLENPPPEIVPLLINDVTLIIS